MDRRGARSAWTALALATALACAGCASRPQAADSAVSPQARQYLFRADFGKAGESLSLRLVLRVESHEQYRLAALDLAGRTLWSLAVEHGGFVLADHRRRTYCHARAERIPPVPLLPIEIPLAGLPDLLLGRLPVAPPRAEVPSELERRVEFEDDRGQRWQAHLEGRRALAWSLADPFGRPMAWWQRADGVAGTLVAAQTGASLRWRLISAERPPSRWGGLTPPNGFTESDCAIADLP